MGILTSCGRQMVTPWFPSGLPIFHFKEGSAVHLRQPTATSSFRVYLGCREQLFWRPHSSWGSPRSATKWGGFQLFWLNAGKFRMEFFQTPHHWLDWEFVRTVLYFLCICILALSSVQSISSFFSQGLSLKKYIAPQTPPPLLFPLNPTCNTSQPHWLFDIVKVSFQSTNQINSRATTAAWADTFS